MPIKPCYSDQGGQLISTYGWSR